MLARDKQADESAAKLIIPFLSFGSPPFCIQSKLPYRPLDGVLLPTGRMFFGGTFGLL